MIDFFAVKVHIFLMYYEFNSKSNPISFVMNQLREQLTTPGPVGDYAFRLFFMLHNYRMENEPGYGFAHSIGQGSSPAPQWVQDASQISRIMYGNPDWTAFLAA